MPKSHPKPPRVRGCIEPILTPLQVMFIRDCYRMAELAKPGRQRTKRGLRKRLAEMFGVSKTAITRAAQRRSWKHVRYRTDPRTTQIIKNALSARP